MFLIDTDVLSAARRAERHPQVTNWLARQEEHSLFVSVITLGEIEDGVHRQLRRNPPYGRELAAWLDQIITGFDSRILAFEAPDARQWGRFTADLGYDNADLQIAATALVHGLTVVTRNVRHFKPTGVRVHNPFGDDEDSQDSAGDA